MDVAGLFVQSGQFSSTGSANAQVIKVQGQQVATPISSDNSCISAIIATLEVDYNNYKYTVYRCASKFVTLQKIFNTSKIPYKLFLAVLERHGMHTKADNNLMVPPFQLTSLLHDIYFACEKLGHFTKAINYQLDVAISLLANFFWNIFDPHRRHSISLLEIKSTFLLLCKLYNNEDLSIEFYNLVADVKTKCVSKFYFEYLLNIFSKIMTYIGEGKSYGAHNIQQVMNQSYARCHNNAGLTEYQFYSLWTSSQTRFLIYANLIALIKRIEDTEHLIHNNPCSVCRLEHIIGIRFKCQICRNISLCLKCFASGCIVGKHESTHRMFEVFTEDQPTKKFTYYLSRLCSFLSYGAPKQVNAEEEERKGFCNAHETADLSNDTEMVPIQVENKSMHPSPTTNVATTADSTAQMMASAVKLHSNEPAIKCPSPQQQELSSLTGLATTATNASERLQSIIDRLLEQNAKLEAQLKAIATSTHEEISRFLSAHQTFLVDIINEMRNLSNSSTSTPITVSAYLTSSTPNRTCNRDQPQIAGVHNYQSMANNIPSDNLTHSINGADLNRSYLEANKSDYSLNDISIWFDQRKSLSGVNAPTSLPIPTMLLALPEEKQAVIQAVDMRNTEMSNFKLLLHKVKEIVEDSYSDNAELSAATQNLENVLDNIIKNEEHRRLSA